MALPRPFYDLLNLLLRAAFGNLPGINENENEKYEEAREEEEEEIIRRETKLKLGARPETKEGSSFCSYFFLGSWVGLLLMFEEVAEKLPRHHREPPSWLEVRKRAKPFRLLCALYYLSSIADSLQLFTQSKTPTSLLQFSEMVLNMDHRGNELKWGEGSGVEPRSLQALAFRCAFTLSIIRSVHCD